MSPQSSGSPCSWEWCCMYQFKWPLCKKKCSVLLWCYIAPVDREQDLWRYWLPEGCIKQWYDKPTGGGCLQEVWAGGGMKQWHCCILYIFQVPICIVCKHKVQKHFWSTPLTRISIAVADISLLPLLLFSSLSKCQAVILLTYMLATKIWRYDEFGPWHIIHICFLCFKILT
jgi:hypothetical protein